MWLCTSIEVPDCQRRDVSPPGAARSASGRLSATHSFCSRAALREVRTHKFRYQILHQRARSASHSPDPWEHITDYPSRSLAGAVRASHTPSSRHKWIRGACRIPVYRGLLFLFDDAVPRPLTAHSCIRGFCLNATTALHPADGWSSS